MKLILVILLLKGLVYQSSCFSTDEKAGIPVIRNEEDLVNLQNKIDQVVHEVEFGSNATSRFLINAGIVYVAYSIFSQGEGSFSCKACQAGVAGVARLSRLPFTRSLVLFGLKKACQKSSNNSEIICRGLAESTGNVLYDVLNEINLDSPYVRQMTCYSLGNMCDMPEIKVVPLKIPQKPVSLPKNPPRTKKIGGPKYKYILQLSDLHYDSDYKVGAEADCSRPLCCQRDSNDDAEDPKKIKRPASKWGDYRCDINYDMLTSILTSAKDLQGIINYDMVLFTGDIPAHDIWKADQTHSKNTARSAFQALDTAFNQNGTIIVPAIGNHEPVPLNQFPLNGKINSKDFYLYKFLASSWNKWLPKSSIDSIIKGGYYSLLHGSSLKIITINTNFCYTYNFHLLLEPENPDPNNMLKWLIEELQQAENMGQRVYIQGHIPPGSTDCYRHWSDQYYRIIQRYSHIISAQFYGHTHFDEFEIFYSDEIKQKSTAISHAYIAPSMTTFDGHNPGFRVYKVDSDTYQVIDYIQIFADLIDSDKWTNFVPWEQLYSARETYGKGILRDNSSPLTPAFWHQVTQRLSNKPKLFEKYYQFRKKNSYQTPPCKDTACHQRYICSLRAGRSRDTCDVIVPFS